MPTCFFEVDMNRDREIVWTKAQMFEALRTYQTGLGEIQQHLDELAASAKKHGLTAEIRMFLDQMLATIVSTTVDAAQALGD
jgi:hypothetical protein